MESRNNPKQKNGGLTPEQESRLDRIAEMIRSLPHDRLPALERSLEVLGGKPRETKVVTPKEAAQILSCSRDTVIRMIKAGDLKAIRFGVAGNFKIPIEELDKFLKGEKP